MTCTEPITVWQKNSSSLTDRPEKYYADKKIKFKKPKDIENYIEKKIACGRCIGCRLDHANMWATRIEIESKKHKENCFITLTYNNENLPVKNGKMTLRKKDIQDFIKRLRYHLKRKISYFLCGEYGGNTYRPHYHVIIFGWKPDDLEEINMSKSQCQMYTSKKLEKIWGNGYIVVEELNYKTACYTARYVQKKAGLDPQKKILDKSKIETKEKIDERTKKKFIQLSNTYIKEPYDYFGREKEFILMSKKPAIGLEYWKENKNEIKRNYGILIKIDDFVRKKAIPRYFKKIWEKENMEEFLNKKHENEKEIKRIMKNNLKNISDKNPEKKYYSYVDNFLKNRAKYLKRNQI